MLSAAALSGTTVWGGTLNVTDSTFSHNVVTDGGGAIYSEGSLTISDSILEDNSSSYYGGGIASGGPLTITNSNLSRNSAMRGGGIDSSGPLTVTDSTLEGNKAVWYGAAILNGGPLTVSHSTFTRNSVVDGVAAINNNFSGAVTVSDSTFTDNYGSGVAHYGGVLDISRSTFSGNSGGGIFNNSALTVSNSILTRNSGGAVINYGNLTVSRSTFSDNANLEWYGGGAICNFGTVSVSDSTLSGNSASSGGGAINSSGILKLTDSIIVDNSAGFGGGIVVGAGLQTISNSILSGNSSSSGGAVYNNFGTLSVTDSVLSGNSASGGGAIVNFGTLNITSSTLSHNSAVFGGGGIQNSSQGTVTVANSTLSSNSAVPGGGGGIESSGLLTVSHSTVSENSGGGIASIGTMTVSHTILSSNLGSAISSGGSLTVLDSTLSGNSGSGIRSYGPLFVSNSTLSGNSAIFGGGGIDSHGPLTVANSTLVGNSAPYFGGGIYSNSMFTITNTTLSGNSASYGGGIATDLFDDSPVSERKLANTIIAGNFGGSGPDVYGRVNSIGHNLVGVIDSSSGWFDTDMTGTSSTPFDPLLGPLQDNGGPTWTMALLADSPAINQGNNALAGSRPYDQRGPGYPRILGGTVDIGAFEKILNKPPIADAGGPYLMPEAGSLVLDGSGSSDPDPGNTLTYAWDLDGDGVIGESGAAAGRGDEDLMNPVFSAAGLDGPSTYVVSLRVTDEFGAYHVVSTTIHILNVAPTVTLSGPTTANEGQTKHYTFTTTDPGPDTFSVVATSGGSVGTVSNVVFDSLTGAGSFDVTFSNGPASSAVSVQLRDFDGATSNVSTVTVAVAPVFTLSGLVFSDFNNDGEVDFGEKAIQGVVITLSNQFGTVVATATTNAQGIYEFTGLVSGQYYITEQQPTGYSQGTNKVGTLGGTISAIDQFFVDFANAAGNTDGLHYNFAERPNANGNVQAGQTASIGFWQNKNGQALIVALNGGSGNSTQLGNWLAMTFPNMYGAAAGTSNLTGKTNTQVAAFYVNLFKRNGQTAPAGPPKVDAQVMATALAVYVTNRSLAGDVAVAYGFQVSVNGVGYSKFNVGTNGAAFGVANGSSVTVMDLLLALNTRTRRGLLFDTDNSGAINSEEQTFREMANTVFSGINDLGHI